MNIPHQKLADPNGSIADNSGFMPKKDRTQSVLRRGFRFFALAERPWRSKARQKDVNSMTQRLR